MGTHHFEIGRICIPDSDTPLTHQLLPIRFSLLSRHRFPALIRDQIQKLHRKLGKVSVEVVLMRELGQPLLLLRGNLCGRGDPERRVDEEEYEDFAVPGFLWIDESEGLDLVLVQVWE